jgi:hypothetical protein
MRLRTTLDKRPPTRWTRNFIKSQKEFKLKIPKVINKYRIAACTQEKLIPFYNILQQTNSERNYIPSLIFNYDETSLLRKHQNKDKIVISSTSPISPTVEEQPVITKCTACLCIAADGSSLPSALIIPSTLPSDIISEYKSPYLDIHQTPTGFINSNIFKKHFLTCILPEIARRQKRYSRSSQLLPALIFLDGHSSRRQFRIWNVFRKHNVDVCILPSHTSHILQPLDCGVNSQLKLGLSEIPPLPQKRKLDMFLLGWIQKINDAISNSLSPEAIRHGFRITGLWPIVPEIVLRDLPPSKPEIETKRHQKVDVSGQIITEISFLTEWSEKEHGALDDCEGDEIEFEHEENDETNEEFSEESDSQEITHENQLRQIPDSVDLRVSLIEKETEKGVQTLEERFSLFRKKTDGIQELIQEAEEMEAKKAMEKRKENRKAMNKHFQDRLKGRSVLEVDSFFGQYLSEVRMGSRLSEEEEEAELREKDEIREEEEESHELFSKPLRMKRMKELDESYNVEKFTGGNFFETLRRTRRKLSNGDELEYGLEHGDESVWKSSPYKFVLEDFHRDSEKKRKENKIWKRGKEREKKKERVKEQREEKKRE